MKLRMLAAFAALAVSAATTANAVTVTLPNQANQLFSATGQTILWDFDGIEAANTDWTGNVRAHLGAPPIQISDSAPPPLSQAEGGIPTCCQSGAQYYGDPTNYASVQQGGASTFDILNGYYLTAFSFYMGSPDIYNHITFHFVDGGFDTLDGDEIWGGAGPSGQNPNGDRTRGFRIYYDFEGAKVNKITFATDNNAFEFDGLAGVVAIPEPTTWALMIGGFGMTGAMLRRRRPAFA